MGSIEQKQNPFKSIFPQTQLSMITFVLLFPYLSRILGKYLQHSIDQLLSTIKDRPLFLEVETLVIVEEKVEIYK